MLFKRQHRQGVRSAFMFAGQLVAPNQARQDNGRARTYCASGITTMVESRAVLHSGLIIILPAITVPVTTLLFARVVLFRRRTAGAADTPLALTRARSS